MDVCVEILRGNPRVIQWRRSTGACVATTSNIEDGIRFGEGFTLKEFAEQAGGLQDQRT